MILLDRPYISNHMREYLIRTQHPVLHTPFSETLAPAGQLRLVDNAEALRRCRDGERVYTTSENTLDWLYTHLPDAPLVRHINTMKDKAALRAQLHDMYPDLFFRKIPFAELASTRVSEWKKPFILKPATGFFSLGVYTIHTDADYAAAVDDITHRLLPALAAFPASVVNESAFIVEEYINGEEYAVDMYYDHAGEPVILNILHHRFASPDDVRDRLYCTNTRIMARWLEPFTQFFRTVNSRMQVRDFPAHVELRVRDEQIIPIEFNPMRFAGLCTTDIAYHAYGYDTFDMYLNDKRPDVDAILHSNDDLTYGMLILDKPDPALPAAAFDFDAFAAGLQRVLDVRRVDLPEVPVFGFVFAATDGRHADQLDTALRSDLTEFVTPPSSC